MMKLGRYLGPIKRRDRSAVNKVDDRMGTHRCFLLRGFSSSVPRDTLPTNCQDPHPVPSDARLIRVLCPVNPSSRITASLLFDRSLDRNARESLNLRRFESTEYRASVRARRGQNFLIQTYLQSKFISWFLIEHENSFRE